MAVVFKLFLLFDYSLDFVDFYYLASALYIIWATKFYIPFPCLTEVSIYEILWWTAKSNAYSFVTVLFKSDLFPTKMAAQSTPLLVDLNIFNQWLHLSKEYLFERSKTMIAHWDPLIELGTKLLNFSCPAVSQRTSLNILPLCIIFLRTESR